MELLGSYSNQTRIVRQLSDLGKRAQVEEAKASAEPGTRPKRLHRLTPDEIELLVKEYKAGARIRDLALEFGMHRSTITAALHRASGGLRPRGLSEAQIKRAKILRKSGWTYYRIGRHLNRDPSIILRTLRRQLDKADCAT